MPSNNGKGVVHYWAGRFPGLLGHLYSPAGFRGPFPWLPYALDNGVYGAWEDDRTWDAEVFRAHCDRAAAASVPPLWVAVPDWVADRQRTLDQWAAWAPALRARYGWPLALVVQDGMTPADVRPLAPAPDVLFIGGSTTWKHNTVGRLARWLDVCPRVHVGRINSPRMLWECAAAGVESCDGTGWFRGDPVQLAGLERFLIEYSAGARRDPTRSLEIFDQLRGAA